jgi:hypothetical protein
VNNENGNEVSVTVPPATVEQPQLSPAVTSPLPKTVQTKKRKGTYKKPQVLSSSSYKNTLLATRKEPSNIKQTTLRYDGHTVASTCSATVEEEKLTVLVVTKPMKNLLLRTGCNAVGVNNGGMKTVQATKAWESSNATYANAHS